MTIENVTEKTQIAAVQALASAIWNEHYTPIIGKEQVDYMLNTFQSRRAIAQQIKEGTLYYLFKSGSRPVGYMSVRTKDDALFLSKFYIAANERNRGYAKEALIFLQVLATQQGLKKIALTVNKNNTLAITAYERLGFSNLGTTVQHIGNGFVMDDYKMEKEITTL